MEREYYSEYRRIEDVHWWFEGRRRVVRRVLDDYLPEPQGAERSILDVGCGTGAMLHELETYGAVTGVDGDREAVRFCRERGFDDVRLLDSQRLPWPEETFDVVTAFDVIEHIDDDVGTLREIRRVLRPEGSLVLTVPAYQALWGRQDEISHHKRRYRAGQLRDGLRQAGFRVSKLSYFNTLLFPPIALIRLAMRLQRSPHDTVVSDFTMTRPGALNRVLARMFGSEAALVGRWNLPFGVSIVSVAVKPGADR